MGYYKNLEIAGQVEEGDRRNPVPLPERRIRRRVTYRSPEVVTDRRTLTILLGSSIFFSTTTVILCVALLGAIR
jgi:hypothetical protein